MSDLGSKRILACIRCSEKRVKCDRLSPCSTCIKQKAVCQYRLRKTRVSRNRQRQAYKETSVDRSQTLEPGPNSSATPEDHNESQSRSSPGTGVLSVSGVSSAPQVTVFRPQLLQEQEGTKLIDNSLWSRIAQEIPRDNDRASGEATNPLGPLKVSEYDDFSYILGRMPAGSTIGHPSSTDIRLLYQAFIKNVDPLVKIIHVPSFQLAIEKAVNDLEHVPKAFEAFMFSMYSMAVLSMTDAECTKTLRDSRKSLLAFFVGATKAALLRARFMSSTNLVVLQALTLHLFSIRDDHEPRAVWALTGLALRVAQVMGLFIDGSLLGLSPFETEIRRRIWWQLKRHDSKAAELCGQAKFFAFDVDEKTPKMPANINDCDLSPSMKHTPVASVKPTEMIWNVVLSELSNFGSTHNRKMKIPKPENFSALSSEEYSAFDDIRGKDAISEEIEELMETKYLRFCDPSKPLHMLTLVGTRCATDIIRFVAHHPRRWTQQPNVSIAENKLVWDLCLQILDRTVMMQSMTRLQQFAWIVPYYIQWPVVIHILDTLRTEPAHPEAEKAWGLINALCDLNADMLLNMDRPIFVAIGSLCLKAYQVRTTSTATADPYKDGTPKYIAALQRPYKETRVDREDITLLHHQADDTKPIESSADSNSTLKDDQTLVESLNSLPALDTINEDSFWFDLCQDPSKMDVCDDINLLAASNDWLGITSDSTIDWSQWDNLVANNRTL